jgi:ribosomal protein S18 acetylase RimI-like enzyme
MSAPDVALRPAGADDAAFFARVYASTRAEELARAPFSDAEREAFLEQQFAAQSAHYARVHGDAAYSVVLVDGAPAGRLIVASDASDDEVQVVDVALLPAFRGRGVGRRLLEPVLAAAQATGRPVGIHVERTNAARRLYERLGFVVVGDDGGVYLKMVCAPDQPKTAS